MEHMMEHKELLHMIEDVSPDDTAKLDEIDARVTAYILGGQAILVKDEDCPKITYWQISFDTRSWVSETRYTRSRDALKEIRPVGWTVLGGHVNQPCHQGFKFFFVLLNPETHFQGKVKSTEELAELHAIIQAIAYERSQCTA